MGLPSRLVHISGVYEGNKHDAPDNDHSSFRTVENALICYSECLRCTPLRWTCCSHLRQSLSHAIGFSFLFLNTAVAEQDAGGSAPASWHLLNLHHLNLQRKAASNEVSSRESFHLRQIARTSIAYPFVFTDFHSVRFLS